MGTSTNAEINYGLIYEEGYEFPWGDQDIEDWWLAETGWTYPDPPFTPDGDWSPGWSDTDGGSPRLDAWYNSEKSWLDAHPCPFVVVNYQSENCACAYMLAVPGVGLRARRGDPTRFDPIDLRVPSARGEAFITFLDRYNLLEAVESEIGWYLTSYWG